MISEATIQYQNLPRYKEPIIKCSSGLNKFFADPVGDKVMTRGMGFIIRIIITAHMTPMLMPAISLLRFSVRNFPYEPRKLHPDHFVPAF